MRKLTRFAEFLVVAALAAVVNPGLGWAQTLILNPSPIAFSIPGPGGTAVATFSVNATTNLPVTSLFVSPINTTSGGSWLTGPSGTVSGNQFTLNVGNSTNLVPNTTYQGSVGVTATTTNGTIQATFPVTLLVGNTPGQPGTTNSLISNPSSITFSETSPGQASPSSQVVSATLNGVTVPIISAIFQSTPSAGNTFVNTQINNQNGTVIVSVNSVVTSVGTYTGTLTVNTVSGTVQIPVTLCFGPCASTGGGNGNGLTATPNPVSFQVQTGGAAAPVSVAVNFNGTATNINSVTATTNAGGSWLLPSSGVPGIVSVGVNVSGLTAGTYVGNVLVNTPEGQITFQVNLTVGGTPTLTAAPAQANFAYQIGTNNPFSQTISITSNGSAVSFSVVATTTTGGAQWLVVSPAGQGATPATLTVSVQPSGLPAGVTYTGNIQISTFGGATNGTLNVPVSLLVSSNPIVSASPAALTFTAQAGGAAPQQNLQITSSSTPFNYTLTSSVTSPPGGNWLQAPTQTATTPGTVAIGVNTAGLAAGTYSGAITITAVGTGNGSLQVPVTLTITAGSVLQLTPAALSFAYEIGQAQPPNQSVTVGSAAGVVGYTVAATTNNGQAWLNTSPSIGTAPGNFVVSVNAAGLLAGTYMGSIAVTANSSGSTPQMIPVTLVVSATALLVPSPTAVTFNASQGSTTNSFVNVSVTSTDTTPIAFNVSTTTNSVSNWMLVSASTGTTPAVVTISANPNGLAAGTYIGTVTLTATTPANVANSPQAITVTLTVAPTATLTVSQNSLSFSQSTSGPQPNPQTVSVSSVGGAITFADTVTLNSGFNWLSVTPVNATTPAMLTVTANGANLGPGTYTGQITLSSPGAAGPQTIQVSLTVSNAPTIAAAPSSLGTVNFQIGGANPQPQTLAISVSGGANASFTATANTISGAWLSVTPVAGTTPSNVTVNVSPAGLTAGSYTGSVSIAVPGATNTPLIVPINLVVAPMAVVPPTVVAIQNAASSAPTSLSPGLNIVIFGSNMGPATLAGPQLGSDGKLATTVSGTQVTFDGIPSPVIYTKNTQVSVMVPYELTGRATTSLVVNYNGVGSAPLQLRLVDSAPGIYTLNQTGSGQGAILNQNGSVNGPNNPEVAGDVIQIFATGEGQTSPAGVDGAVNPGRLPLPAPLLPVTVTIGGIPVPASGVTYAGEAPGIVAGVLQVDATIPAGAGTGAVPVVIQVGSVMSQANVTVTLR